MLEIIDQMIIWIFAPKIRSKKHDLNFWTQRWVQEYCGVVKPRNSLELFVVSFWEVYGELGTQSVLSGFFGICNTTKKGDGKKVGKNLFTVIFYKRKLWTKSPSVEQTHVKLFTILLYGSCKNRCYAVVNNMNWWAGDT